MKTDGYYRWLEETSKRKEMAAEQEKHRVAEAMLVLGGQPNNCWCVYSVLVMEITYRYFNRN